MSRKRKIDITLTKYKVKAIKRSGEIKYFSLSLVGKYSEKEIIKFFDKVHGGFVYKEVVQIDYIKNHYEVDLWDLYDFCEEHQI